MWQLSKHAGLVFQNPAGQMLAHSVTEELVFGLENLGLPIEQIEQRVAQALDDFGLAVLQARAPQTLSGGEQQKLALAAILVRRPEVLVLDEPLSMLDTSSAFLFVDQLNRQAEKGTALVICEHRQEYLQAIAQLQTIHLQSRHSELVAGSPPEQPIGWHAPGSSVYQLQADALHVRRGGAKILDNLSLTLQGGQVYSLVGPNGVGKTTLLRTLAGLQPYQGELAVVSQGQRVRPRLGMVFQNPDFQLFNASVREEILFRVSKPDEQLYGQLLAALSLERYEQAPPLLLSEGEKRRLALATVLMHRPEHGILLDEPALGQDAAHKQILIGLLHTLAQNGLLVLFCTHDIELAAQADQMLLLSRQGILASGPPATILNEAMAWEQLGLRVPEWVAP
jgi:energy-coupling factor transport system ATP-binding protein